MAEKLVAILLTALLGVTSSGLYMIIQLNREVGTEAVLRAAHEEDHPNIAIEEELQEINKTLVHIDDRLDDLEIYRIYGPPPPR